jgi:acetyl esterase/lipase
MPLDPHAKRLLDMLAMTGAADASHATVNERRDVFRKLMRLSASDVVIRCVEDRVLPGPGGPICIRIYTPAAAASDQLPGLVYFHGGGLVAGGLDTHDGVCRMLANETGCRLASVDYRLAPEHKFPAAVVDGYAATMWVIRHAAQLGIIRRRIAVGGDSAGGALAIIVAQLARQAQEVELAAQLLLCPITDFGADTVSRRTFSEGHLLDKAMMERDLEHYLPAGMDATDPRISPLRASDFSGLPKAYIHTAEFDPLRDEGRAYADRLTRAGVEVKYTCHPGMVHLFYAMANTIPYARTAVKRIGADIRAALG